MGGNVNDCKNNFLHFILDLLSTNKLIELDDQGKVFKTSFMLTGNQRKASLMLLRANSEISKNNAWLGKWFN